MHNALGQRVFQGEPMASQTLPNQQNLGQGFIEWLKSQFGWLFQQQATTSLGTAFVYADGHLPSWAILGDYDNGSASGVGRSEYIWLPTQDGNAIPVGLFRNGRLFAVHTDHLGTPRLMTNDLNKPVWQWPYSAFGMSKPTGILKATAKPKNAMTNQPVMLKSTVPAQVLNLRDPGQYEDTETGLRDNINRMLSANTGRYTQSDPIGTRGGPNRFIYVENNPLMMIDPWGLMGGSGSGAAHRNPPPTVSGFGCVGLMCASGSTQDDGAQFSAELSFGGGIEICDAPPPPKPAPETCPRNQGGMYGDGAKPQPQFPGLSVPKRFGGAFIGPSMKTDGRVCVRIGPHVSVPFPSLDLGGLRR